MKKFNYKPADAKTKLDVIFTSKMNEAKDFLIKELSFSSRPMYIVDAALPNKYIEIVKKITGKRPVAIVKIKAGKKTLDKLATIWDAMVKTVPDVAIVIGGGAVCDLAGVACANYQRGIPRILFPTTVLAQVDASIGGKTGIDFAGVKNSVGAIHYPLVTVNYMPFLNSLPFKEYISGFSEIVKAGILYDKKFFNRLHQISGKGIKKGSVDITDILFSSASIKAKICEEKEGGKIRLLYGHAIGHAIESMGKLHLRHGDCVAIGMHLEGAMACMMNIWRREEWQMQYGTMKTIGLPTDLPNKINIQHVLEKMLLYKKLVNKDNYLFVLPKNIGIVNNQENSYLTAVPKKLMHKTLEKALHWSKQNLDV